MSNLARVVLGVVLATWPTAGISQAQEPAAPESREDLVQLDFQDVELPVIVDTLARLTGKTFLYDDRVRGRVTLVSPTAVSSEQAHAILESALQVKGFTTVPGPGGAIRVIPIGEAKGSAVDTSEVERSPEPGPAPGNTRAGR